MNETVHIQLEGKMVKLLLVTKFDPKLYRKCVKQENDKTVLHAELVKALCGQCGTLRAALSFWRKLLQKVQEWGFKINPCDWCAAKMTINGKQCTTLLHVNDLKTLPDDPNVETGELEQLNLVFRKDTPITIQCRKMHECLGMRINYCTKGQVKILMKDYIQDMLKALPNDILGDTTPAALHLFKVNDKDLELLNEHHLLPSLRGQDIVPM